MPAPLLPKKVWIDTYEVPIASGAIRAMDLRVSLLEGGVR